MSSGRLGKAALAAAINTDLYTVPAATVATINVEFCNRTAADIPIRFAVRNGAVADSDWLEYDSPLPANGVIVRSNIVVSAGEIVTAYAAVAGVSVRVHGFEEEA